MATNAIREASNMGMHSDDVLAQALAQRVRSEVLVSRRAVEVLRGWMLATGNTQLRVDIECSIPEEPYDELDGLVAAVGNAPRKVFREIPNGNGDHTVSLTDLNACLGRPSADREPLETDTGDRVPRFELVVVRDPDGGTDVTVVVDGCQLHPGSYTVHNVDAGRGYTPDEWAEVRAEAMAHASPAAAAVLTAAYDD